jgi:hypothetical protein
VTGGTTPAQTTRGHGGQRRCIICPAHTPWGHGEATREAVPGRTPNPYEAPRCQETDYPYERIFCFVPPSRFWRSHPLAPWSDLISLGRCSAHVSAPNPYGGSTAIPVAIAERVRTVLCALETSRYPHTALLKRRAAHLCAPVSSGFGGGAAHSHHQSVSPARQEQEEASNQTRRVRANRLWAHGRSSTHGGHRCSARSPG